MKPNVFLSEYKAVPYHCDKRQESKLHAKTKHVIIWLKLPTLVNPLTMHLQSYYLIYSFAFFKFFLYVILFYGNGFQVCLCLLLFCFFFQIEPKVSCNITACSSVLVWGSRSTRRDHSCRSASCQRVWSWHQVQEEWHSHLSM